MSSCLGNNGLKRRQPSIFPFVSIIVIVLNMEKTIGKCLTSLLDQDYPSSRYEIIVVDGGSSDDTQSILREHDVKMLIDLNNNRSVARNLGIKHSRGELVAFIDADCIAQRKWLQIHVRNHVRYWNVGAIGGSIVYSTRNDSNENKSKFANFVAMMNEAEYSRNSPKRWVSYIPTCNSSFKKKVLKGVGLFDERLHVGEDTQLCSQIIQKGFSILFDPSAEVTHCDAYKLNRMNVFQFIKTQENGGNTHYNIQLVQSRLKYRLPMFPPVALLLLPGIVLIRAARYLHKMRYLLKSFELISYISYVISGSVFWSLGYFGASCGRGARVIHFP